MKFRVHIINLLSTTSNYWFLSSNPLYSQYQLSFLIHHPHYTRRTLWMNNTKHSRHWRINIFHLYLHPYCTRTVLRLLPKQRSMIFRNNLINHLNSHSLLRLCITMRTNIILSSNSNHKPINCRTILRKYTYNLVLGRILN